MNSSETQVEYLRVQDREALRWLGFRYQGVLRVSTWDVDRREQGFADPCRTRSCVEVVGGERIHAEAAR